MDEQTYARLGRNCQCSIAIDKQSTVFLQKTAGDFKRIKNYYKLGTKRS
ncbi:hypothetical protein [Chlamydia caviae]|nr:hypothetical protein [Chlamydia caviae]